MHVEIIIDGVSTPITGNGVSLETHYTGYLTPRIRLETVRGADGLIVISNQIESRTISLPFVMAKYDRTRLLEHLNSLLEIMLPGNFYLRFTSGMSSREVHGVYLVEGPEDDGIDGLDERTIARFEFTFLCTDPYWYNATPVTTAFLNTGVGTPFFPFFPLVLLPSMNMGQQDIVNVGMQTWPIWTILGPGEDPSIRNVTTGKELTFSGLTLAAGEVLTLDHRPGIKSIIAGGVNAWEYVVLATSNMWSLEPGLNTIAITMNATTAASAASMSYYERYASLVL